MSDLCLPDANTPPCGEGSALGVPYDHVLYVHCGVKWTFFDGRYWVADPPLTNGSGSPPSVWADLQRGEFRMLGVDADEAQFRSGALRAHFVAASDAFKPEDCD